MNQTDFITDLGVSCPWTSVKYTFTTFIQIFLILADNQNWLNILCFWISSWLLVSSSKLPVFEHNKLWYMYLKKHYADSQVSDRCPLVYLLEFSVVYHGRNDNWMTFDTNSPERIVHDPWKSWLLGAWPVSLGYLCKNFKHLTWNQRSELKII